MTAKVDLTGQRFGRLLVVEDLGYFKKEGTKTKRHWFRCICDCGNELITSLDSLKGGNSNSCGCLSKEVHYKTFKKYNEYYVYGDIVFVKFTNCNEYFICDLDDWERLKDYAWCKREDGYAITSMYGKTVRFHKLVLECDDEHEIDHKESVIKSGVCDNRKSSLRVLTHKENLWNGTVHRDNKTGVRGVSYSEKSKLYRARIFVDGHSYELGNFKNIEDAIKAREEAEKKYFGSVLI